MCNSANSKQGVSQNPCSETIYRGQFILGPNSLMNVFSLRKTFLFLFTLFTLGLLHCTMMEAKTISTFTNICTVAISHLIPQLVGGGE